MQVWFALVLRSGRALAPALILVLSLTLVLPGLESPLHGAALLFPVFYLLGGWIMFVVGNVDDDPHREILCARVGSAEKLHLSRVALAGGVSVAAASLSTVLLALASGRFGVVELLLSIMLISSGGIAGVAIGSAVCRPILRGPEVAVVLLPITMLLIILAPPTRWALRSYYDADGAAGWVYGAGVVVVAAVAVRAGSRLAAASR